MVNISSTNLPERWQLGTDITYSISSPTRGPQFQLCWWPVGVSVWCHVTEFVFPCAFLEALGNYSHESILKGLY